MTAQSQSPDANARWTHTHTCTLTGSPARVFAALTDANELRRWFAEHVEVELQPGGAFRFWGRHTYGLPRRDAATQRIIRLEPNRVLTFSWTIEGMASEVTLEIAPAEKPGERESATTSLAVRHEFASRADVPYGVELVDDLWRLTLGNLDAPRRGGDGIVLPDFSDPAPVIRLSIIIDAPKDRVFRALIEPQALDRWIASAAEVEPRTGGRYTYSWKYQHGGRQVEGGPTKILDIVENERLVTDWTDWRGDETRPLTRIAWLLEDAGHGTRVTLIHSGFSRVVDQSDYPFGWREFLNRLKREAETSVLRPA
jgi:uncharacterized protein YndB with AHSA1/START domain